MAAWGSTGIEGLDNVFTGLRKGDNVVWQVDNIDDFSIFVKPYVERAIQQQRKVVYMRFADHKPLVEKNEHVKVYNLDAGSGFETFTIQIHEIIADQDKEAYYVFDCLSYLLDAWATDLMIGNFFMVTCPYLYELDTIAYFALLRDRHSFKTIARIRDTTQLLIDLYNVDGSFCLHPLKVWKRYSPTMFLPHMQQNDVFIPITSSVDASKLLAYISERGGQPAERTLDYWDKLFMEANELVEKKGISHQQRSETLERLCKIMIGRDERILSLAQEHFTIEDLYSIKSRMIGTGFIGGKAVGMLLANKIVSEKKYGLEGQLEPHDSFYIGSDVFYTYLVENDCWKMRVEQKTKEGYFKAAEKLREKLLTGRFPDQIRDQLQEMIEYFGQSPIIVRSSSLLEDAFGNAFAGKYESLFCVNQGNPEERYEHFLEAVRLVYASTMSEDALTYRLQRGLDQRDEQMALLVQRVSGSYRNSYFFPDLAGVGMSMNAFVWKPDIDPKAGMLRLVFGLGTRAVNRVEDDYPRIIALDDPLVRPVSGVKDIRKYSQHTVDILDTSQNLLRSIPFRQLIEEHSDIELDLVAVRDYMLARQAKEKGKNVEYWLLTFEKLLGKTDFVKIMRKILGILEDQYQYPIDIEFTVNFAKDKKPIINLLQCRPLQTRCKNICVKMPEQPSAEKILFKCEGYFMGGNICQDIKRIIYVEPQAYIDLPLTDKYEIARIVGRLNKMITNKETEPTLLLGPGRWGTSTPSLGVSVGFHEINNIAILTEIAYEGANLIPELSFGTHFFQDLVESEIFYLALFPGKPHTIFNIAKLDRMQNKLAEVLPESSIFENVVRYYRLDETKMHLISDLTTQKLICLEV